MKLRAILATCAILALAACNQGGDTADNGAAATNAEAPAAAADLTLTRLDCGTATIKDFDKFFSDRPGLYPSGPRKITDSCYLIRHGDQLMLWDTGLSADLKGSSFDTGDMVASVDTTIAEQLAALNLKPSDIDVVGISHSHGDHTGQAALFPQAHLLIGAKDFELAKAPPAQGGPSPIAPWLNANADVTKATGNVDVFGDGSVIALHLPGHTPDHYALLVNLKSGPVLLSGDLYHSLDAREKRGVPPFNTSREQTLESMDAFEALAKRLGAKVIIQHEPADVAKLPAFPEAAR
jgi:glyoxylase-like metal-dependent hydrolase (beta-lactamase superfamily II)